MQSLFHSSPPWWDGEKNKKKGWGKNGLTEQQREKKMTTIILIKRTYSMQCSYHPWPYSWVANPHASASSPTWILSMISHGIEHPIWLAVWVSLASFLWKLTLSQLNPGHYQPLILYHLCHAQGPHFPIYYHDVFCLYIHVHIHTQRYHSFSLRTMPLKCPLS